MFGAILRERTRGFRRHVAAHITRVFRDPNQLTMTSLIFALIFVPLHYFGHYFLAFIFMVSAYLVDVFDGSLAELLGKKSKWGNYLDAMVDKYVEAFIYVGLGLTNPFPALLAALGSLIESYAKPRVALVVPIDNHDWPAIGERVERCAIIAAGYFTFAFFGLPFSFLDYVLYFVAALTWVGSVQRMLYAKKLIERS